MEMGVEVEGKLRLKLKLTGFFLEKWGSGFLRRGIGERAGERERRGRARFEKGLVGEGGEFGLKFELFLSSPPPLALSLSRTDEMQQHRP